MMTRKSSPTSRRRQRGQTLILIFLGTLLIGGSAAGISSVMGGQDMRMLRKRVDAMLTDDARRAAVEATLKSMETEAKHLASERAHLEREAFKALADHDTTDAQLDAILAQADDVNIRSRDTLLTLRFALRDQFSADQWRALFAPASALPQ